VDIDLDRRTIATNLWSASQGGSGAESQRALGEADAKQLREIASCALVEAPGKAPQVSDFYVSIVLDGDTRREIKQSGPMTAPCAKQLQAAIEKLAPWPD